MTIRKPEQKTAAPSTIKELDITCALDGDIIVKEYTFPYAVAQWDPRVIH